MLHKDFREFLELLDKHKVRYVVVGGYALAIHGHPRYTGDLDIFVATDVANAQAVTQAVREFGFALGPREAALLAEPNQILELGREPLKLQLLTAISGISFEECYAHRLNTVIDAIAVTCISRHDLLINKRAAHRPQDLADVAALESTMGAPG